MYKGMFLIVFVCILNRCYIWRQWCRYVLSIVGRGRGYLQFSALFKLWMG